MAKGLRSPSQSWKTFLRNHAASIAALDLFVVPTVSFSLLPHFAIQSPTDDEGCRSRGISVSPSAATAPVRAPTNHDHPIDCGCCECGDTGERRNYRRPVEWDDHQQTDRGPEYKARVHQGRIEHRKQRSGKRKPTCCLATQRSVRPEAEKEIRDQRRALDQQTV